MTGPTAPPIAGLKAGDKDGFTISTKEAYNGVPLRPDGFLQESFRTCKVFETRDDFNTWRAWMALQGYLMGEGYEYLSVPGLVHVFWKALSIDSPPNYYRITELEKASSS